MPFPNPSTQFQPGKSGNPSGRPVGRRSLAIIIRDMLENEINWDLIPIKDSNKFKEKYKERSAWEALVAVAFSKALAGDTKAMQWLSRSGYGDKMTIDHEPGFFNTAKLEIEIVNPKADAERDSEASPGPPEQPADS